MIRITRGAVVRQRVMSQGHEIAWHDLLKLHGWLHIEAISLLLF